MQVLILAAGMGTRLGDKTINKPKCMVMVNGKTIIERILNQIETAGVSRCAIVTGYLSDTLKNYVNSLDISIPICFFENKYYKTTNNIFSLALAKDFMTEDDTILLESDLVIEDGIIESLINDKRNNLALVDKYQDFMDGTCLKLDNDDTIISFQSSKTDSPDIIKTCYKTVNIYKLSSEYSRIHLFPELESYIKANGKNDYYEKVMGEISKKDTSLLKAKVISNKKWYEIDTNEDLLAASKLFD